MQGAEISGFTLSDMHKQSSQDIRLLSSFNFRVYVAGGGSDSSNDIQSRSRPASAEATTRNVSVETEGKKADGTRNGAL